MSSPQRLVSFNTEHRVETDSTFWSPIHQYEFITFVFVVERATNKSVPITMFGVGEVEFGDLTTTSLEVSTTNQFTYGANDSQNTTEVESRTIFAQVKYSIRARMITFAMLILNYLLASLSVVITVIVVVQRERVKDSVALLPVTIVLSIPAIRCLYVGSPPFGIYIGAYRGFHAALIQQFASPLDLFGFFPQMFVALMSTAMVLCVLAIPWDCLREMYHMKSKDRFALLRDVGIL